MSTNERRLLTLLLVLVVASFAAAAAECADGIRLKVSPRGRVIPGQLGLADVPIARVTITAKLEGEPTEADWCAWTSVRWPDGTESTNEQDCSPWDEHLREVRDYADCQELTVTSDGSKPDCPRPHAPARQWSWARWFPAGEWSVPITLHAGRRRVRIEAARFTIPGAADPAGW